VKASASTRRSVRFVLLFAAYFLAGFALLRTPFADPVSAGITNLVTEVSAFLIRLFGGQATANGDLLAGSVSTHVIRVADGCNGLHVSILLWAAVAAFPASLARKVKGLAAGTAIIHAANLLRVISLFYLEPHGGAWFDFAHLYLWEALIVLGVFAFFGLWAQRVYQPAPDWRGD